MTDEPHRAPGALGNGYTLCGVALEGNPGEADQPPPIVAARGRPISCPQCVSVIRHCREEFQSAAINAIRRRA